MKHFLLLIALCWAGQLAAQYKFTVKDELQCTEIKNQQRTGTCWSFSTVSFLEAELIRMGKTPYDLSEMYIVRNIYKDKARNYVLRQGKANFSQGSLNHDVIRALSFGGIIPESIYSGKLDGESMHDHSEMERALKGMLDGILKGKRLSNKWMGAFECILDTYMGSVPERFTFEGKSYTPESFTESLGINPADYVTLTSFSHHPFYESFILEIPDNYSNGSYFNIPLDELQAIADYALSNGYTVAWDGDVGEKGFSAGKGIAVIPADESKEDLFDQPIEEAKVDQQMRQEAFESYATTDDHLMHLTGTAVDQKGTKYYITKNSWGEISPYKGFLYMSSSYFRMKTVGIMVHKDAIPKDIAEKLSL
jgi:bleomycin hydrolase